MKYSIEDLRYYADKHRGKNKTTGPNWPILLRFPELFDEYVKMSKLYDKTLEDNIDLAFALAGAQEENAALKAASRWIPVKELPDNPS